jgi:hypothetical protein
MNTDRSFIGSIPLVYEEYMVRSSSRTTRTTSQRGS